MEAENSHWSHLEPGDVESDKTSCLRTKESSGGKQSINDFKNNIFISNRIFYKVISLSIALKDLNNL